MTVSECSVNANLGVRVDQLDVVVEHVQGGFHLESEILTFENCPSSHRNPSLHVCLLRPQPHL